MKQALFASSIVQGGGKRRGVIGASLAVEYLVYFLRLCMPEGRNRRYFRAARFLGAAFIFRARPGFFAASGLTRRAWPMIRSNFLPLIRISSARLRFGCHRYTSFLFPISCQVHNRLFVHISAVEKAGLSNLNEGQVVEYEEVANKGKTSAENLKVQR